MINYFRNKIRNSILKNEEKYANIFHLISKLFIIANSSVNSKFFLIRWITKPVLLMIFSIIKDDYYKILLYKPNVVPIKKRKRRLKDRLHSHLFFAKTLAGNPSTVNQYLSILQTANFNPEDQYAWAHRFLNCGRIDLASIAFLEVINRKKDVLSFEKKIQALRELGTVLFMSGDNNGANYYWAKAGKLRRIISVSSNEKRYRILGYAWFIAIGHIAMLDYYLKFKKLYFNNNDRIVVQWDINTFPSPSLMNKFTERGIVLLKPGDLEKDYDKWAKKNNAPKWSILSSSEKFALIDDFWEYDFPDGVILGYAHAAARIQKEWENSGLEPLFKINDEEKKWLRGYLSTLGLPEDAWYVCLHVREGGFHKNWNSLYPSMRDANINDYFKAIEDIVNAGGWVLRMGDSTMQPLAEMKNVIDYAHHPLKTSLADILLVAGCRFFIGTNSGYANIASIYAVPCLLTNWVPLGWPLWPSQDLMIPKLFRNKETNYYYSLEEIFEKGLAYIQNWSDVPEEIELISNTPEEISAAIKEMLNVEKEHTELYQSILDNYNNILKSYHSFTGSRLSKTFVEKYSQIFLPTQTEVNYHEKCG